MNWEAFRKRLVAEHHNAPQIVASIEQGVAAAKEALSTFAKYGHQFHLAAGPEPAPSFWPRIFFHASSAPNGRVVRDEEELASLGSGWYDELAVALAEDAEGKTRASKLGLGRSGLPVALTPPPNMNERLSSRLTQHAEAKASALKEKSNAVSREE